MGERERERESVLRLFASDVDSFGEGVHSIRGVKA